MPRKHIYHTDPPQDRPLHSVEEVAEAIGSTHSTISKLFRQGVDEVTHNGIRIMRKSVIPDTKHARWYRDKCRKHGGWKGYKRAKGGGNCD
jgi:hypothetical protein